MLGKVLLAARDRLRDRRWSVVERLSEMRSDRGDLGGVTRPVGVLQRALESPGALAPVTGVDEHLALQPPGLREPEVVAELFQQRNRSFRQFDDLRDRPLGMGEPTEELSLDDRAQLQPAVPGRRGRLRRLRQNALGPPEVAGAHERAAELGQKLPAQRMILREEQS
jgi:hypothetical protein